MPADISAIKDAVNDLVATCRAQGTEVLHPPKKPISFAILARTLEEKGLIEGPSPPHLPGNTLPRDPLQAVHEAEVGSENLICNEILILNRFPSSLLPRPGLRLNPPQEIVSCPQPWQMPSRLPLSFLMMSLKPTS